MRNVASNADFTVLANGFLFSRFIGFVLLWFVSVAGDDDFGWKIRQRSHVINLLPGEGGTRSVTDVGRFYIDSTT